MKYAIISYVALGLILALAIGIKYNCEGHEMFPTYYGSPLVFKQKSLGSSMEYFYSISGLLINILIWSLILFFIDKAVQTMIRRSKQSKLFILSYKMLTGLLIAFTTVNFAMALATNGRGFKQGSNYWYWNMDKEARDWGMTCKFELVILRE